MQMIDDCCSILTAENMKILRRSSNTSEVPVFIAGLPRSGTTLLEQFIDAHPDAAGIGELSTIDMADLLKSDYPWPGSLGNRRIDGRSDGPRLHEGGRRLGGETESGSSTRVAELTRLPLIAMLLPKARVIHIRRIPGCAVSCFMSSMHPARTGGRTTSPTSSGCQRNATGSWAHWKQRSIFHSSMSNTTTWTRPRRSGPTGDRPRPPGTTALLHRSADRVTLSYDQDNVSHPPSAGTVPQLRTVRAGAEELQPDD